MFLNLTNHPSSQWAEAQLLQAKQYGGIVDMPFPVIDPEADSQRVSELVLEYYKKIEYLNPKAIHIMGEMTFTFGLVTLLQKKKITCLASTTRRTVTEKNGEKISKFEFVQFRIYRNE
jgi:hypothetical protein